jgi:hypothetical protein
MVSRLGQQKDDLAMQALMSNAGVGELYDRRANAESDRGREQMDNMRRTDDLRSELVNLMGEIGSFKTKYNADRDLAEGQNAAAEDANRLKWEEIAAGERNAQRGADTKLAVTKLMGLEGLAKTMMIGQERGKALAPPQFVLQALGLTSKKKKGKSKPKGKVRPKRRKKGR